MLCFLSPAVGWGVVNPVCLSQRTASGDQAEGPGGGVRDAGIAEAVAPDGEESALASGANRPHPFPQPGRHRHILDGRGARVFTPTFV